MNSRLTGKIRHFLLSEDGPTSVEYAVLMMLIFMGVVGSFQALANGLGVSLADSQGKIVNAIGP